MQTVQFHYQMDYSNGGAEMLTLSYIAPLSAPLGGQVRQCPGGIPTRENEVIFGAFTKSFFLLNVWEPEYYGLFSCASTPYPGSPHPAPVNLDPTGRFGPVSIVLEIAEGDYLVAGFGGFGRLKNGVIQWCANESNAFIPEVPSLIATDGNNALFVYTGYLGSYPGPYETRYYYTVVPLTGGSTLVDISAMPYLHQPVLQTDAGEQLAVLGAVMPGFTLGAMHISASSPDGRYGSGVKMLTGPARPAPGGGHYFDSYGTAPIGGDLYNEGYGSFEWHAKSVAGVIDTASLSATSAPIIPNASITALFPPSLPGGYVRQEYGATYLGSGYSFEEQLPQVFWTNLRLTTTL